MKHIFLFFVLAIAASAQQVVILDDFEKGTNLTWSVWGPRKGSVARIAKPGAKGSCLRWDFGALGSSAQPSGLNCRDVPLPSNITSTIGWSFCFSLRGDLPCDGFIALNFGESDGSRWQGPVCSRLRWSQGEWREIKIPLAALCYGWGNDKRANSEFDLRHLKSVTLVVPAKQTGSVLLDNFRLEGRDESDAVTATVLPLDFRRPPLNRFGRNATLPSGTPPVARDIKPTAGSVSRVSLRGDGVALLNGAPFFPIGAYGVPADALAEVADAGFNTILNYRGDYRNGLTVLAYLDRCATHGLMGVVDVEEFTRESKTGRLQVEGLAELVNRAKNHPALLAWYIADEPEYAKVPHQDYIEAYKLIKRLDPDHPVIMVNNQLSALANWPDSYDILMPDPYPDFFQAHGTRQPLTSQGAFVLEALRQKPRAVWFVPQFHNGACYGDKGRERGDVLGRTPTIAEVRFMFYSAVTHGARGIIGWPFLAAECGVRDCPEFFRGLKAVAAEMKALSGALTAADGMAVTSSEPAIKHLSRTDHGDTFIIAVNNSDRPVTARFRCDVAARSLLVVSEKRSVRLEAGQFRDSFGPWQTHIYTTAALPKTKLADLLPAYVEAFSMAGTVHPLRDSNLASYLHGSRAIASSIGRYTRAAALINGSYAGAWTPDPAAKPGHWFGVDFRRRVNVARVVVSFAADSEGKARVPETALQLQVRDGDAWRDVPTQIAGHFFIHWNAAENRWERSQSPTPVRGVEYHLQSVENTALRFNCDVKVARPAVLELEAFGPPKGVKP